MTAGLAPVCRSSILIIALFVVLAPWKMNLIRAVNIRQDFKKCIIFMKNILIDRVFAWYSSFYVHDTPNKRGYRPPNTQNDCFSYHYLHAVI